MKRTNRKPVDFTATSIQVRAIISAWTFSAISTAKPILGSATVSVSPEPPRPPVISARNHSPPTLTTLTKPHTANYRVTPCKTSRVHGFKPPLRPRGIFHEHRQNPPRPSRRTQPKNPLDCGLPPGGLTRPFPAIGGAVQLGTQPHDRHTSGPSPPKRGVLLRKSGGRQSRAWGP